MASTLSFASSDTEDTSVGTFSWTNRSNAYTTDASLATLGTNGTSYYGIWKGFSFSSPTIPAGSTIDGIEFSILASRSSPANAGALFSVRPVKGGTIVGTDFGSITLTGSLVTYTVGGSSSLLGTTWTESDVVSSNFGIAISGSGNSMGRAQIDSISCRVYFTAPASGRASLVSRSILVNGSILTNGLVG